MKTVRSTKITKIAASVVLGLGVVAGANAVDESFNIGMKLLTPIAITEVRQLDFVDTIAGADNTVVTAPADPIAAVFNSTGDSSKTATASVVEGSVTMLRTGGTPGNTPDEFTVDSFALGGAGITGGNQVDYAASGGSVNDIRVGGTANILAEDLAGNYTGTATLRIVYN